LADLLLKQPLVATRRSNFGLAFGQQAQVENADGVFGIQMFLLRREQGRLAELAPAVRYFVRQHTATTWRPGLALIYSELGPGLRFIDT
jgi:hypothetical protein